MIRFDITKMLEISSVNLTNEQWLYPLLQELRQNDVIDRLKAFTIIPSPGTTINVAAGKHKVLTLAYSADSLSYGGLHDLPILVRVTLIGWAFRSPRGVVGICVRGFATVGCLA